MKKTTKILSIILALVMVLSTIPMAVSAEGCDHVDANKDNFCDNCSKELYVERSWNGTKVVDTLREIPADAVVLASSDETISITPGTTYVVDANITISQHMSVEGTAGETAVIILKDDCTLTLSKGLRVPSSYALAVCGQANDSGKIIANGTIVSGAIGVEKNAVITFCGGTISASALLNSAAIGGERVGSTSGNYKDAGAVVVYGGIVSASSNGKGAGIGGCFGRAGGNVTVYGGVVTAAANTSGSGIGGGLGGNGGNVAIYGGTVTATSNPAVAGIGGGSGDFKNTGTLTVAGKAVVKAGASAEEAVNTTVEDYIQSRDGYVYIHVHDFTGSYVDNENGTHSQKCSTCGEYAEPTEHTYVNGVCVCGAKDPTVFTHTHTFAEEWTINETAHWYECTAEDCDIEDYATCGIAEAAYGEHTDTNNNFYCDVCGYFDEAAAIVFYVAKYKADIKDNLLPAAKCDEAREILNKAYEDLDTVETYDDVQSIYNTAKGMSGGKNSEFTSKLSSYKSTITINLGDSPAAARDNFVENTINALENSQSIAELDKAFNNGTSQISYYKSTDANVNAFNNRINSGELSDESIAIAQEAIEKINEAKTYAEVGALSNKYHSKIDIQIAKEKASAELTAIAKEKNNAQVNAIVNEALAAIDEATAVMDINDIKAEAIAKIEALPSDEIISITEKSDAIVGELVDLEVLISKPVKKLVFVDAKGNTYTYGTTSANTVSVVNNDDGTQVWTVKLTVRHSTDEYTVKVKEKSSGSWSDNTYDLTIEVPAPVVADEIISVEIPDAENGEIKYGTHDVVITTGKDVSRVQIAYAGTTATYSKSSSKANVAEDGDTLVWTISFNFYKIGSIDYAFASRSSKGDWKTSDITETIETYKTKTVSEEKPV